VRPHLPVLILFPSCPSRSLPFRHYPDSCLPVPYFTCPSYLSFLPARSLLFTSPARPLLYLSVIIRFPAFLPVPYFTCPSFTFPGPCLSFHSSYPSSSLPSPSSSAVGVVRIAVARGLSRDTCLICPANAIAIRF
jgi:hypothetical protein